MLLFRTSILARVSFTFDLNIYIYIHIRKIYNRVKFNDDRIIRRSCIQRGRMYQVAGEKVNWFYIKLRVTTFRHAAAVVREKLPGLYSETSKHVASIPLRDSKGLIESFNAFVRCPYLSLTASFPAFILIIRFNEIRYVEEFNKPLLSSVDNYWNIFPSCAISLLLEKIEEKRGQIGKLSGKMNRESYSFGIFFFFFWKGVSLFRNDSPKILRLFNFCI